MSELALLVGFGLAVSEEGGIRGVRGGVGAQRSECDIFRGGIAGAHSRDRRMVREVYWTRRGLVFVLLFDVVCVSFRFGCFLTTKVSSAVVCRVAERDCFAFRCGCCAARAPIF